MALSIAQLTFFSRAVAVSSSSSSFLPRTNARLNRFIFSMPFSGAAVSTSKPNWRASVSSSSALELGGVKIARDDVVRDDDPTNNVPDSIFSKLGMQLHKRNQHPLGILKNAIYEYFDTNYMNKFDKFDDLCPLVTVKQNFDDVLVPADHVSRRYNDTYYVDSQTVLRCHTSAHQAELLRNGHTHFLVTGDVYRRDSIDSTHYPVFHQMEGFRVFSPEDWEASGSDGTSYAAEDLKKCLEGLAVHLFGAVEMRWIDAYFPFTNPSFELEIYFQEKWMEVLGCGVTEQVILRDNGQPNKVAWAFGLGLERLAMVLFDIPDIRLFWSNDKRFTSQVQLIDNFTNKKGMTSHCYRIAYRSMERSLTDDEINRLQEKVREEAESKLNVVLR
ncbi:Phenylalanine--tRNA ligase, chloroplastic/mitochondrial [Linum perenne]